MESQTNQSSPSRPPSLLPAFEPLSSSPLGLPRARKRDYDEYVRDDVPYYPTPVPTSSTILPSSPQHRPTRPALPRTVSALSERAPLGAVPNLNVPIDGEPILMGRSSNSSDYQLSSNRMISRVHVRAKYHASTESDPEGKVIVECLGWNGAKVHFRGTIVDLVKGQEWTWNMPHSQIIVDVQDTRVLLSWPRKEADDFVATSPLTRCGSPTKRRLMVQDVLGSSPPSMCPKIRSPVSLSPRPAVDTTFDTTFIASQSSNDEQVEVYEDHDSADEFQREATPTPLAKVAPVVADLPDALESAQSRQSSTLSESGDMSEHDEENDPIIFSFGPFGANLLSKFSSFRSVASPDRPRKAIKLEDNALGISLPKDIIDSRSTLRPQRLFRESPIKNHVVNQLAFSRVHSVPLSVVFSNVPSEIKMPQIATLPETTANTSMMTQYELNAILERVACIGKISREGKDAAGKALENEFYYIPEKDDDEMRKEAVNIARPPLRNVRKSHKQYYWKKPK